LPRWPHKDAAIAALGLFSEIIKLRGAGQNLRPRFGEWFALFGREQNGDALCPLTDEIGNLMQYCGAGIYIDAAPIGKALCCRSKRFIKVCRSRQRQLSERFASGRIYDGVTIAAFALAPAAINIKA